ncbi:MAG: ATP-binding protein [Nitrososphaerota archaeon]|nr:ATP-binding protein [Nitrososphaerota archaeon]MDG7038987.1 ATP-binding protein [Nitrososphaerota archaeon]
MTNQNVAIFELVKNSYDAASDDVYLVFENVKGSGDGTIYVVDSGCGMSRDDLINKWLFAAYSEKKPGKKGWAPPPAGRQYAGLKGIGRFACDTLGSKLVIYTKKADEERVNRLEVDWGKFEKDQSTEFGNVPVMLSSQVEVDKAGFSLGPGKSGTILQISGLRNSWDEARLISLKKYLQRLVAPAGTEAKKFRIHIKAEEFLDYDNKMASKSPMETLGTLRINGEVKNFVFEDLELRTTYIECSVGEGLIRTRLVDKGEHVFDATEQNRFPLLHDIDARIYFLNREAKASFKRKTGVNTKDYGSVFLYKNAFRIYPYGEPDDDWLGLEMRRGQGWMRHLSAREFIGTVRLRGMQDCFTDASSREGLLKNEAYNMLVDFIKKKVVSPLERYVVGVIGWDSQPPQEGPAKEEEAARSIDYVSRIIGSNSNKAEIKLGPSAVRILDNHTLLLHPELEERLKKLEPYLNDKASIDTVNWMLGKFNELRRENLSLGSDLEVARGEIEIIKKLPKEVSKLMLLHNISNEADRLYHTLNEAMNIVLKNGGHLRLVDKLDEAIVQNEHVRLYAQRALHGDSVKGEQIKGDIVAFIKLWLGTSYNIGTEGMVKQSVFHGDDTVIILAYTPIEVGFVIENLLGNSTKNHASTVTVSFKLEGNTLHAIFCDDGDGVPPEAVKHLFEMGFSTTGGTGLGLYASRKAMREMGGDLLFVGSDAGKGNITACFDIVFGGNKNGTG